MLLLAALVLLTGCANRKYAVGYDVAPANDISGPAVAVRGFSDARPAAERTGEGVGILNSSTYDTMYTEEVAAGITRTLAAELRGAGVAASDDPASNAQFIIDGTVLNFHAVQVPPIESYIPYLNNVSWLWTDDSVAVSLRLQMTVTDRARDEVLLDRTYDVSQDTAVWVGFLNLDSRVNNFTRKQLAELLQAGLHELMARMVADIRQAAGRWLPPPGSGQ